MIFEESKARMVDVGGKPVVLREAVATGLLRITPSSRAALVERRVPKGDPFEIGRVAGILAAKRTWEVLPLCHPIPLESVEIDLFLTEEGVRAQATVRAHSKTGVEMEALLAVSSSLLAVWDVLKPFEKSPDGNYPSTEISQIQVKSKVKGSPEPREEGDGGQGEGSPRERS